MVVGRNRHSCFFLDLADKFVMESKPPLDQESVHWFFPDVQRSTKQPGATLGEYIKAVRKEGGQKRFKDYPAQMPNGGNLPQEANAAGIRPGATPRVGLGLGLGLGAR